MTILKAEILNHLNGELYRTETDIDQHILAALKNLSMADKFLWVETQVPTIIGRPYYSMPPDYKKLMTIKIGDNKPLEKITWQEYQAFIYDQTQLIMENLTALPYTADFGIPIPHLTLSIPLPSSTMPLYWSQKAELMQ